MGEFETVLRAQIAATRRELVVARGARDYPGIRSFGLRLRYLLDIAEEHGVEVSEAEPFETESLETEPLEAEPLETGADVTDEAGR